MRYKAVPLSVRSESAPLAPQSAHVSGSFRLLLVALLIPVIAIPLAVVNAAASLALSPNQATIGTTIRVAGQGLEPNAKGQLMFDGNATGMPTFRTDHTGHGATSFVVPKGATLGGHTISASVTGKKTKAAVGVAAAALMVIAASVATPSPTSAPTAAPTVTPVPTRTPSPTAARNAGDRGSPAELSDSRGVLTPGSPRRGTRRG